MSVGDQDRLLRDEEEISARTVASLGAISAEAWDSCANPDARLHNPFVSHAFLSALEDAGTVGVRTGWLPQHLVLSDAAGSVRAVMPLYVKTHSQGEYVFDHSWADALHRVGGRYYPKLQCAVPFSPVPGRRLLVRPGDDAEQMERLLASAAVSAATQLEVSSLHITFASEGEWNRLGAMGFLQRTGQQFHWHNAGYTSFEDFLGTLASRKRKALRKERAEAQAGGLEIALLAGRDITEARWDTFFAFYMDTSSRKWGRPYLNREFFSRLGQSMGERCLLVLAKRAGQPIAGALHIIGGDCLYGRYWGALEHCPFLHFELCYYQAIDYAIAHKLARAEAGAQGEHKLARGYLPTTTYSLHWIQDPRLEAAVRRFLVAERREMELVSEELRALGPVRKGEAPPEGA